MELQAVRGLQGMAICVNPRTGEVATAAGSLIVIHSPQTVGTQRFIRRSNSQKMTSVYSCLSFSADGNFLATGEAASGETNGKPPDVLVWRCEIEYTELYCLKGHKVGVL